MGAGRGGGAGIGGGVAEAGGALGLRWPLGTSSAGYLLPALLARMPAPPSCLCFWVRLSPGAPALQLAPASLIKADCCSARPQHS